VLRGERRGRPPGGPETEAGRADQHHRDDHRIFAKTGSRDRAAAIGCAHRHYLG
jgi:hypothetical protein